MFIPIKYGFLRQQSATKMLFGFEEAFEIYQDISAYFAWLGKDYVT